MSKTKKTKGNFLLIPHYVLHSPDYMYLSLRAKALLIEIALQYNGYNNGTLCATEQFLQTRGWRSAAALNKAIKELLERGFIVKTQQGGKKMKSLYGVTWKPLNDSNQSNIVHLRLVWGIEKRELLSHQKNNFFTPPVEHK